MTKIRIHELAKELGIENKELLSILTKRNVEVKNHMSTVEDQVAEEVRKEFRKKTPEKEEGKAAAVPQVQKAAPEKETAKAVPAPGNTENTGTEPPKKKNIVQLFRPQNAKNAGRMAQGRMGQRVPGARPGVRPVPPQGRTTAGQGQRPVRPQMPGTPGQRPVRPQTAGAQAAGAQQGRPQAAGAQQGRPQATGAQQGRPQAVGAQQGRPQTIGAQAAGAQQGRPQTAGAQQGRPQAAGAQQGRPQTIGAQAAGAQQGRPQTAGAQQGRPQTTGAQAAGVQQARPQSPEVRAQSNFVQGNPQEAGQSRGIRSQRPQRSAQAGPSDQRTFRGNADQRPQRTGERRTFRDGADARMPRTDRPDRNDRGERSGRGEYGQRPQGRTGMRREDRDALTPPIVEQQKSQRNKVKEKEKDYKKRELRDEEFENKGKKGKLSKTAAEVKKPQHKQEPAEEIKQIVIPEMLTIKELADKMKVVPSVIVKKLFMQGKVVTVNQEIDFDTAEEIAMEFNILCEKEEVVDVIEELLKEEEEKEETMVKRSPVVCVMGHVDHGKTSLLDAIRHTNVIEREAGGITQHIGAYVVEVNGEKITFLDTPGHEAFTAMRMRGANATDIAILVVAADDGVMPQTVEAISHAKAAGIEIIVAVNKIDKPGSNVERVKQELTEYDLIAEDWGGKTIFVPVSAKTKEGIPELLEMILLTAEVMELKANADRAARGLVIEAQLDKGKGPVATVLVQKGTLHVGDAIAAGSAYGKVRAMMDDKGRRLKEAGPSQPVEILGLNDVPNAGEVFVGCATEKDARNFAETFISQSRVKLLEDTRSKMSLDDLFTQIKEGNLKELNIVVKADVQGSVEALKQSLLKLSNEEVVIKIIHGGVGAINESDVSLASASNAIIIGFNVRPDATAKEIAEQEGVDMRLYRVIYNAIEDVQAAMKGMLDPVYEEKVLGHAEVRQTFKASGVGTIAGAYVQDGVFERNCSVRLTRDGIVIYEGALASLKRFKDDVKEVRAGYECGFVFENYNDVKEGDLAEAFKMVEVERK